MHMHMNVCMYPTSSFKFLNLNPTTQSKQQRRSFKTIERKRVRSSLYILFILSSLAIKLFTYLRVLFIPDDQVSNV